MFRYYSIYQRRWITERCPKLWNIHPALKWRCHRNMKTTQERRRFIADVDSQFEYGIRIKVRWKRSHRSLVNAYDDIPIRCLDEKGWKRLTKKRKQYLRHVA